MIDKLLIAGAVLMSAVAVGFAFALGWFIFSAAETVSATADVFGWIG